MKDRVLVPLDGSALAESILPAARALAQASHCDLALLQVVPRPSAVAPLHWSHKQRLFDRAQQVRTIRLAREYLQRVAQRFADEHVAVTTDVVVGQAASEIGAFPGWNERIAVIAMATHGRGGVNRLLFGSVTEQVLASTSLPLLLARATNNMDRQSPSTYRTIMAPLDGSRAAEDALDEAQNLALASGARVILASVMTDEPEPALHIDEALGVIGESVPMQPVFDQRYGIEQCDDYLNAQADRLRAAGVDVTVQRAHGDPRHEISRIAAREAVDLLVMTTHGRQDGLRHWQSEVARQMLQSAQTPILFVHV